MRRTQQQVPLDTPVQSIRLRDSGPQIVCPKCKGTQHFRYLEDIVCWREVVGFVDGILIVNSLYQTGEGYDDGHEPRFECHNEVKNEHGSLVLCLHEFPIDPDWISLIDWA